MELKPEDKGQNQLATRAETKPAKRRTRKRSTANLDGAVAAQSVDATVQASSTPEAIAMSTATAWKAAVGNAYVKEMQSAVPEVLSFMDQVNEQVGAMLINGTNQAYAPITGDMLVITED